MTRKKWNRLRRQYPELFRQFLLPPPERWTAVERRLMAPYSKQKVLAVLIAAKMVDGFQPFPFIQPVWYKSVDGNWRSMIKSSHA